MFAITDLTTHVQHFTIKLYHILQGTIINFQLTVRLESKMFKNIEPGTFSNYKNELKITKQLYLIFNFI